MEVEAKVRVSNLKEVKRKLVKLGAKFSKIKTQADFYYKEKGKELEPQRPGSSLLRIRHQGKKKFLTLKALTEQEGAWIEHEVEIDSDDKMHNLLLALGYTRALTITKERTPGMFGEFELCLDDIQELGLYLEISLDSEDKENAKKKLVSFLNSLGFKEEYIEHRGYARILFEKMGVKYEGVN